MNIRKSYTVMGGIAIIAATSAFIALKQRQRIEALRSEIAILKRSFNPAPPPRQERSKPAERAAAPGLATEETLSSSGADSLPEIRELIARLAPLLHDRSTFIQLSVSDEDAADRLQELLSGIGGATAQDLFDGLASSGMDPKTMGNFREIFSRMNPQQSLVWRLGEEPGENRDRGMSWDFREWAGRQPSQAMKWYLAAEARGEPVTRTKSMTWSALNAQARFDPVAAVSKLSRLTEEDPRMVRGEGGSTQPITPSSVPSEQIGLVNAYNAACDRPGADPLLVKSRDGAIAMVSSQIYVGSFLDGSATVEACYTPEQKLEFARKLPGASELNPQDRFKWAPWIAELDGLPIDDNHPLLSLVDQDSIASNTDGDPPWLGNLQPLPLRDLAIARYISCLRYEQPRRAGEWLARLPPGQVRQDLAETIAESWKAKNAAAAKAFATAENLPTKD